MVEIEDPINQVPGIGKSPVRQEMVWKELMGKDLQLRTISGPNSEDSAAVQPYDAVQISFTGRKSSDHPPNDYKKEPVFQEEKSCIIVVGDKDVVPALEMAVRFLHEGETAVVWSDSKFALGPLTRTNNSSDKITLPANSFVTYEVTVEKILAASGVSPLQKAIAKKEFGNDTYAHEWSDGMGKDRVKYLYHRAAKEAEIFLEQEEANSEEARRVLVDCLNNIAAVELRAKEYHEAKETAVKVLLHDPNNFKALIRAAKAALLDPASSFEEVEAAIDAAAKQLGDSDDKQKEIRALKVDFKRRKAVYDERTRKMFRKIGEKSETAETMDTANKKSISTISTEEVSSRSTKEGVLEEGLEHSRWALANWKRWPWWDTILPYGFQIIMPFLTYWIFLQAKRPKETTGEVTTQNDHEF